MVDYSFDEMARYVKGKRLFDLDIRLDALEVLVDMADLRIPDLLQEVVGDPAECDEMKEAAQAALERFNSGR